MSILNKSVSYFPSKSASTQGKEVNLLKLLQWDEHKKFILNLRASTPEVQKQLKEGLPCFTVAGTFSRRCEEGIIQLSGLAAVDLDSAEDYDIPHLLKELQKLDCIAYAGVSCRGQRLYCIVPFLYPDKYVKHYERLIQSFNDLGLPMGDECHKQISQPRFVSWNDDSTQFFNHEAKPYSLLPAEKIYHPVVRSNNQTTKAADPKNAFEWCNTQINKSHQFESNKRHAYMMALARYCNIKGVPEGETLNGCLSYAQPDFSESEITGIVKHVYSTQSDSHNTKPYTEKKFKKPSSVIQKPKKIEPNPAADQPIQQVPVPAEEPAPDKTIVAYVDSNEQLLMETPFASTYSIYPSVNHYNQRLCLPSFHDRKNINTTNFRKVYIDLNTLTLISK